MHSESYLQGYLATSVRLDKKPKCTPGNKPCGDRCIPTDQECHVGKATHVKPRRAGLTPQQIGVGILLGGASSIGASVLASHFKEQGIKNQTKAITKNWLPTYDREATEEEKEVRRRFKEKFVAPLVDAVNNFDHLAQIVPRMTDEKLQGIGQKNGQRQLELRENISEIENTIKKVLYRLPEWESLTEDISPSLGKAISRELDLASANRNMTEQQLQATSEKRRAQHRAAAIDWGAVQDRLDQESLYIQRMWGDYTRLGFDLVSAEEEGRIINREMRRRSRDK